MDGALDPFIDASLRQGVDRPAMTPTLDSMASAASSKDNSSANNTAVSTTATDNPVNRPPSFIKQAMRNMVPKGRQSLLHFGLTALGFLDSSCWWPLGVRPAALMCST